ncbi:uncharacterized protein LOC144342973, partial [Saccoglossus kowalevskii]
MQSKCTVYTRLCIELQVTDTDSDTRNNVACLLFTENPASTVICTDVAVNSFSITSPSSDLVYTIGTSTDVTIDIDLDSVNGGAEVSGVKAFFANDDTSSQSSVVDATGTSTAAANAASITDAVLSLTLDAEQCTVYTRLCIELQVTDTDSDTRNNVACLLFTENPASTVICTDVAVNSFSITSPSSDLVYTIGTSTDVTIDIDLDSVNGGAEVSGVKAFFANDDTSSQSSVVDATGTSTAAANAASITDAVLSLTLDAEQCTVYTRLCIELQVTDTDSDTRNNVACLLFTENPASTVICTDVAVNSFSITSPSSDLVYTIGTSTDVTIDIDLDSVNGGAEVSGVKAFFANDDTSSQSSVVDATGTSTAAANAASITDAVLSLTLDAEQCTVYTRLCIELQVTDTDSDTRNNVAYVAVNSFSITSPSSDLVYTIGTSTDVTIDIDLDSVNGGAEVSGVKAFFANDDTSSQSSVVDATGTSTAAANAASITDAVLSLTLDAEQCTVYTRLCIELQVTDTDSDTRNNVACLLFTENPASTAICTDVAVNSFSITSPSSDLVYTIGTSTDVTIDIDLDSVNGGAEVSGVKAFFANDDTSSQSSVVDATGTSTAAANAASITDAVLSLTLDAEQCTVYTRLCIELQVTDTDSDTRNNVACLLFTENPASTVICTDVAVNSFSITSPSSDLVYTIGTSTDVTIDIDLDSVNGGAEVSGVKAFFANDDTSSQSSVVDATGTSTAAANAASITDAVLSLTLDAEQCTVYTRLCIELQVTDTDSDTRNNVACLLFTENPASTVICTDVAVNSFSITSPSSDLVYTIGTSTDVTIDIDLDSVNGGAEVSGVKAFFANDDTSSQSSVVDATGTSTAAANAASITDAVLSLTLDAEQCTVYTRLYTDSDTRNNVACLLFTENPASTVICTDVAVNSFSITSPSSDLVYTIGTSTDVTIDIDLDSVNGGAEVSGVKAFFANDDTSSPSSVVDATGTSTAAANAASITDAVLSLTLDAEQCTVYTRLCIELQVTDTDSDTRNNVACLLFTENPASTVICTDVAVNSFSITSPSSDLVYTIGTSTDVTIDIDLDSVNGGAEVSGVKAFFANDDTSSQSSVVDATGTNTAAANAASITDAVLSLTLDAEQCTIYTRL